MRVELKLGGAVVAVAVLAAGCSLSGTDQQALPPGTPAGNARAQLLVLKLADFPSPYRASGKGGEHGPVDCVRLSGLKLVGRAYSSLFSSGRETDGWPAAASVSLVFPSPRAAAEAFASVRRPSFAGCLRDSLGRLREKGVVSVEAAALPFEFPSGEVNRRDVSAHTVALKLKSDDGSTYPAYLDVVAVRLGRSLVLDSFTLVDARTVDTPRLELAPVARSVVRSFDPARQERMRSLVDQSLRAAESAAAVQKRAGRAKAQKALLTVQDVPEPYRLADRAGTAFGDDCLDLSGVTLVSRETGGDLEAKPKLSGKPSVVSTAFVASTPSDAGRLLRAVDGRGFADCLVGRVENMFKDVKGMDAGAKLQRIEVTPRGIAAGDLRAYAADLELSLGDNLREPLLHVDAIVVRVGSTVGYDEFTFVGDRTPRIARFEEAVVANAAARASVG